MYNAILHRWASGGEVTTAINYFDNAGAKGQANLVTEAGTWARMLFNSTEYTTRPGLTPHDFVYDLYQAFLHYAPDQAGWDWWTTQVGASWQNKQTVMDQFINAGPYAQQAGTLYREVLWLTPDHLGTPRMIAERTGALVGIKGHDYLPFGEELFAGQGGRTTLQGYTGDSVRQHFTGYEADTESGLNFAQARYQSSIQGRFTSVDPLGRSATTVNPQSFNRYAYVQNNPVNAVDPSGMAMADITNALDQHDKGIGEARALKAVNDAFKAGNLDLVRSILAANPSVGYEMNSSYNPTAEGVTVSAEITGVAVDPQDPAGATNEAVPVNFRFGASIVNQGSEERNELGIFGSYLLVTVTWQSNTGTQEDLAQYQFREKLEYPKSGTKDGTFMAPEPFNFSNKNPYYSKSVPMSDPGGADRHQGYSVLTPYKPASVTVKQTYQYSKNGRDWVDVFTLSITRSISRQGGAWRQTISLSGYNKSAVIPLPAKGFFQLN